ncbi:MAG: N-6 DNA methylase [Candidatus Shapirobacteria bacterium]|nr:N-6 DNA methylase [Candidatus Shapirobacteria bacterium]
MSVLTPHHITSLFTDLVDVKINDVFFDPACGTGAFLIAGMQKLIELINNNPETVNKQEKIDAIRKNQLIGFEKNTMMYTLAISNMLFRGDGKSHIFNEDFFSKEADDELISLKNDGLRPTIGFVNPPYGGGGLENKKNPTPKEIEFLVKMLDLCSRYCVIIAPLSTYCKDTEIRNKILSKHTLKYVINMPKNLFMPNAATNRSIAVFETFKPQGETETIFFDLKDDGYVLTKNRGRYDLFNKWTTIKKDLIVKISNPSLYANDLTLVKSKIRRNSEWLIQDYSKTDYGNLSTKSFINTIKKYLSYIAESKLDLFGKNIDSLTLGELVVKYFNLEISKVGEEVKHCDTSLWKEFSLYNQYFDMAAGKYYPVTDFEYGETPLISASNKNNGVMAFTNMAPVYRQECLTIGKVDMSVFYQSQPFCATSDVTILIPKCSFNKYIAMFMITMISQEGYKWSYGRQIRLNDSQDLIVRLPSNSKGDPDWIYMENFIKKLPYSDKL